MKAAFIADVHAGNHRVLGGAVTAGINDRCRAALSTLREARRLADEERCYALFILGDLFDTHRPSPQVITATADALAPVGTERGSMQVVVLVGNHDRATAALGDNALGPLARVPNLVIVERPKLVGDVLCVPYHSGNPKEWLSDALILGTESTVLATHFGIYDAEFARANPWCVGTDAIEVEQLFELMRVFGVKACYSGDWHVSRAWVNRDLVIQQVGALVPTGFDNPGVGGYGGMHVVDTDNLWGDTRYTLRGPRFVEVREPHELYEALAEAKEEEHSLYVRWKAQPSEMATARATLAACDDVFAGQVVLDNKVVKTAAHRAAESARSQETLVAAARGFVSSIDLPDDLRREDVWDLTAECLGV